MANMIGINANMIQDVTEVLVDVQTELIFFGLAVATHLLFFGKSSFKRSNLTNTKTMNPGHKGLAESDSSLAPFKAALRARDMSSAMVHFEALHGLWQQHDSPSSAPHMWMEQLTKLAAQKERLPELLDLVNRLGLIGKALNMLLAECADQNDFATLKKAEQLAREQGVKFSAVTFQTLLKCAGKCGNMKGAQLLMSEAQQVGMADVSIYCTFIKGLVKAGDMREVKRTTETMRVQGLQLSTITFNGILSAVVASNVESAWSLIGEMEHFGVKPDPATCSIILKCITPESKSGTLDKVMVIINDMIGEVDEVLANSVVEASLRAGRADLLVAFLKKKRESKSLAIKSAHTYASIIRAYGYTQDVKGVWETWHDLRRQHVMPLSVTVGCMVEALVTNGDIQGGYELVHEVSADEKTAHLVNAVMYGSILKGFSHKKCFDRVWEVYAEMVEQKLKFSMVTFNTLIDACARSGDLDRIPSLLKDIQVQGLKMCVVTYSAIVKGYCQANRLDEALELVEDMRQNTDVVPDEIMYNTLLDGCARQNLYDRGMALLEQMRKSGVRPSNFTLSVLVKLAYRGRKLEKAFQICDELSAEYRFRLNVHVFSNLVQACIYHHDLPRAMSVLETMLQERVRPDVRTYSLLLRACIEKHEPTEAVGLLRAATGLGGAHHKFAKSSAAAMQPQGGLPGDLISEILSGIVYSCKGENIATPLFVDLSQKMPGLKLDAKLRLKLTARMTPGCVNDGRHPWSKKA